MSASSPERSEPSTSNAEPRTLGPYEILTRIAPGGMSVVYLARRTGPAGFRRLVALKVCRPELRDDPEFVRMFLTEARLAAAIHHPNVVPILEVAQTEETYLVMEYVEGASLSSLTENEARLPIPVVLRVCVDALRGLSAAHALTDDSGRKLGVVHRDVSPQNILVGVDGRARITDFGVARAAAQGTATASGVLKGKIAYMPPEQLRHEQVDHRGDIFAAGVVVWEALTGERLFRGETPVDTMARVLSAPIHAPSMLADDVPEALDDIVLRALSRDPETRWQTVGELADALCGAGVPLASPEVVRDVVLASAGAEIERLRSAARAPAQTDPTADIRAPVPAEGTASTVRARRPRRARVALLVGLAVLIAIAIGAALVAWPIDEGLEETQPSRERDPDPPPRLEPAPPPQAPPVETVAPPVEPARDRSAPERERSSTMRRRQRPAPAAPMQREPEDYMPTGI